MFIDQVSAVTPSRRTILTAAVSSLLGGVLAIGISTGIRSPDSPLSGPQPPVNPSFVQLGRTYLRELGKTYSAAWDEGAKGLEGNQSFSSSLNVVVKTWGTNRVELFDRLATPEFRKVIPETKQDADVTPQERAAMAAAWRGFALGLRK